MSITKYGAVESEISKTAEGRKDAEQQRKEAEIRRCSGHEIETRPYSRPKKEQ